MRARKRGGGKGGGFGSSKGAGVETKAPAKGSEAALAAMHAASQLEVRLVFDDAAVLTSRGATTPPRLPSASS
jgi:hypothetical protein